MKAKLKFRVLLLFVGLVPFSAMAVQTISQPITQVLYNASTDYQYFLGSVAWGASGCSTAIYVQILPSVSGKQNLLAVALAAYVAGKTVYFQGTCDSNTNYFDATYISVSG